MDYLSLVLGIILINLLLSGDNALVIALASRELSPKNQNKAMFFCSLGAIVFRVILALVAVLLPRIAYLQLFAGAALLWIAVKLATEKRHFSNRQITASTNLLDAVKTILAADLIMSIDNVIAIAAIAKGNITLIIIGLAFSIPVIIWGGKLMLWLISRWPFVINIGAAFLSWTGSRWL